MPQNKCTAIILAGGKSERMGRPKGLLMYKGHYWLLEHLNRLKAVGINDVIIGLGFAADTYSKAIPELQKALNSSIVFKGLQISVVQNENPELGSFSTLQKALKTLNKYNDVLICPIDVPLLNSKELKEILKMNAAIVKPIFNGQGGHPIKINYNIVSQILNEDASNRLDNFIASQQDTHIKVISCIDKQITLNLNRPSDWQNYLNIIPLSQK